MSANSIVSFSLYGRNPLYTEGAILNARDVPRFYPGWGARFFVADDVPPDVVARLAQTGAEIVHVPGVPDHRVSLWRFQPFADPRLRHVVSRDCDSRLSQREVAAVEEWIASGAPFHIMRDHPLHVAPIMAGMCGGTGGVIDCLDALLSRAEHGRKGIDQEQLARELYPLVRDRACIHDSFPRQEPHARPFPTARHDGHFVGQVVQPDGSTGQRAIQILRQAENAREHRPVGGVAQPLSKRQ